MNDKCNRYVGNPDFHDGFIRAVSQKGDRVLVAVEGATGKRYAVAFEGVSSMQSLSPQDMMLYALTEQDSDAESLRCYDFVNWHIDQLGEEGSKSYLRIVAKKFSVTVPD